MNHRIAALMALATVVLVCLATMGRAATYDPGVSVGHWVKYGNFVVAGLGAPLELSEADWMKIEVTAVSGKNVTLHMSGEYKNGTEAEETSMMFDLEIGAVNGSTTGAGFGIIAGNLQAGDSLPTGPLGASLRINKTETRTYVGAARSVNIVNITVSSIGSNVSNLLIYDKVSGMLLEANASSRSSFMPSLDYSVSYSAIDTNIFATGTMGWLQDNMIYVAIAIIIVLVVIVAAFLLTRKKPSPSPPSTEEATPETQPASAPNA